MRPARRVVASTCFCVFATAGLASASSAVQLEFSWRNPTPQGNPVRAFVMVDELVGCAVGDFGATLRTTDGGVSWTDLTQLGTFLPDLHDVVVDGGGALLAVGDAPGVFRSTDDGGSWSEVANPSVGTVHNLFRIDATTLSATGDGGRVYRSFDDGATWSLLSALGGQEIADQWWRSSSDGWIIGPGHLRHTTNAGVTWSTIPGLTEGFFFAGDIQFQDALNGWILEDFDTYRTTDGGASWFSKHGGFSNSPIYQGEAAFQDANTRWVCSEGEGAEIWRTNDDGLTWTRLYQNDIVTGITDLQRLASGVLLATSWAGDLLRSTDGGTTWANAIDIRGEDYRFALDVVEAGEDGKLFAGGASDWLESLDSGRTWFVPATTPGVLAATALTHHGTTWYVGGTPVQGQSRVSRSIDDGATWQSASLSPTYQGSPVSISAPADGVAFVATYGGSSINYVFRTTDSGTTWEQRSNGVAANQRLFSIFFVDESTGYAAGGDFTPALYRTTDGGGNWVAVAANGIGNDVLTDMYWTDANVGVAAGLDGTYRTTDGGVNWTVTSGGPFYVIEFEDDLHGYARRIGPGIYETDDGGISWQYIDIPCDPYYEEIAAVEGGFVTVGKNRTIFLGVDADPTGVSDGMDGGGEVDGTHGGDASGSSGSAAELQVIAYPNPSDGRVTLRFRADEPGVFHLRIYGVDGRLASAWTEEVARTGAGSAEVAWTPPATGTWFVEVEDARGRTQSGRVVRVR